LFREKPDVGLLASANAVNAWARIVSQYPTAWQRKTMWAALTALFVLLLIIIAGTFVWAGANLISFLQPILIPVAIAAILAYLLDPLVTKMCQRGLKRTPAIAILFLVVFLVVGGLAWWLIPTISVQSANFAKELPSYTQTARDRVADVIVRYERTFAFAGPTSKGKNPSLTSSIVSFFLGPAPSPHSQKSSPSPTASPEPSPTPVIESIAPTNDKVTSADRQRVQAEVEKLIPNLQPYLPTITAKTWDIVKKSVGGFLGVAGFLFSLVMVPIYLFFLLKERPRIEKRWKEYLPLRPSPLKDEVAEALLEINSYLVAYFRGQLLVCLVDGVLIGSALTLFIGLNFAPLIGVLVVILTMIPYIGIVICWIPAVLIAAFQFGDFSHPFWVTVIFIVIQNAEGMVYAPRIVGDSVGLHPMTVIVSIFVWGLLIGGLLGPILAVPLTATVKVLLARYVWGARLRDQISREVEKIPIVHAAEKVEV
jgi:predicted PurR-regulated permease PerM